MTDPPIVNGYLVPRYEDSKIIRISGRVFNGVFSPIRKSSQSITGVDWIVGGREVFLTEREARNECCIRLGLALSNARQEIERIENALKSIKVVVPSAQG